MIITLESQPRISASIRLVLLLSCVLSLIVGCSSRQKTLVSSEFPDTLSKIAPLEETPIEEPGAIKSVSIVREKKPSSANPSGSRDAMEDSTHAPSETQSSMLDSDVFASSGQASPSSSVTLPQSTPVPELAKPNDLHDLPFTLSDIFFDYDQYTLHEDDVSVLETNAHVLLGRYPKKKILIQGHCDERGTEEYNLALGIRRAQAVKDYLVDLGVPPENIGVLSYGKEKPFCTQHTWNCWKHNRRSHFVFQ